MAAPSFGVMTPCVHTNDSQAESGPRPGVVTHVLCSATEGERARRRCRWPSSRAQGARWTLCGCSSSHSSPREHGPKIISLAGVALRANPQAPVPKPAVLSSGLSS